MSETVESQNISEVGRDSFVRFVGILKDREGQKYNAVGWEGTGSELQSQVEGGALCPASSFAVVAEGIFRYKWQGPQMKEDTDSLRDLSKALLAGSEIYGQAAQIDVAAIKAQIKKYVESHGGRYDGQTDWQEFIKTRAVRLKSKADAIDAADM
ncbi:MAG: hypothetical protein ABSE04_01745 [Candidatus Microgenomates bacterium]|jgi:hypothetical protein